MSNRNPPEHMKDHDNPEFEAIMPSHQRSSEILDYTRSGILPVNAIY